MSSKITRRNFLKTSGAAGIGLTVLTGSGAAIGKNTKRKIRIRPIIMNSHGGRPGGRNELGERGNQAAWSILTGGGLALDAVEKCANTIEVDPNDSSVGYGGLPNEAGVVQLDATIVDGKNYEFGAVGALENIKTPSSIARLVMERTDHIMLVGVGALNFAKMHGYKEENLLTESSRKRWLSWKENLSDKDDRFPPKKKGGGGNNEDNFYEMYDEADLTPDGRIHGTVNCLSVDTNGDIAGITTTSGLSYKIPGRLGDSPIIGAGLYGDNNVGAAGATGRGEEVIKTCGSFMVVEFMRQGMSPQEACEAICQRIIDNYGGNVNFSDKFVALNMEGELGCASIRGRKGSEPQIAYIEDGENKQYQGTILMEI
ncbi:isoaspartyl peptidase/L-asparaginase [candidate division KSB1 bacterium]|nr:isoaspartyl peptidase/L-asparaginase [candidate division KSB1 bacterium]